jgi:hypothetical protein
MPRREMTHEIASAAGADAANRRMRADGRDKWDDGDWDEAAATYERLMGPPPVRLKSELERGEYDIYLDRAARQAFQPVEFETYRAMRASGFNADLTVLA